MMTPNHALQRFDGLGSAEKDLPKAKVWRVARPSVWAHASQLLPGHRVKSLYHRQKQGSCVMERTCRFYGTTNDAGAVSAPYVAIPMVTSCGLLPTRDWNISVWASGRLGLVQWGPSMSRVHVGRHSFDVPFSAPVAASVSLVVAVLFVAGIAGLRRLAR
jgi:hypothetical protein